MTVNAPADGRASPAASDSGHASGSVLYRSCVLDAYQIMLEARSFEHRETQTALVRVRLRTLAHLSVGSQPS